MDRVTDVISRFMDEAPVFDTIHESPIELSVVDALRTAENWQVAVEAVTKADYMVADVSGFEPGVMLLLGLRSVVRRGVTLSVSRRFRDAADARETPFNVQETRVIPYDTNEFYMRLSEALREGVASLHSDLNYLDLPAYHAVRTPRSEGWAESGTKSVLMLCPFLPSYGEFFVDLREIVLSNTRNREPLRMLDLRSPRLVGQALYEQIRWATFCIVDWTYWRPNVFFEFGVRLACAVRDPLCIYEQRSAAGAYDEDIPPSTRPGIETLQQLALLKKLFGPIVYDRDNARENLRQALRDWRSATLDAPWQSPECSLPSGSTLKVAQSSFVWSDDPLLIAPHREHRRTIERIVGKDPERLPERLTLFADAPAFDAALQESVRERWIAAYLYLRHLNSNSDPGSEPAAELRYVARVAQQSLRTSAEPRHQELVREVSAFLRADRADRRERRSEGSDGT